MDMIQPGLKGFGGGMKRVTQLPPTGRLAASLLFSPFYFMRLAWWTEQEVIELFVNGPIKKVGPSPTFAIRNIWPTT